jgi:hypothetical protein
MNCSDSDKTAEYLNGGGEMGALMRGHDWAALAAKPENGHPHPAHVPLCYVDGLGRGPYLFLQ